MRPQIARITEDPSFIGLQEEWNRLLGESGNNDITLTWEWMYTWWEVFKDTRRRLAIVTARDEQGCLVGIAPLQIRVVRPYRFLPSIRQVSFLAFGEEEVDEICTDYLNFIIRRGAEAEVVAGIFDYLINDLADEWDEILLDCVLGESENIRHLKKIADRNMKIRFQQRDKGPCYYIPLPENWDRFLMTIGAGLRSEYRYDLKRLGSKGTVTYEGVYTEDERERGFARLAELHQQRWTDRGKQGAFSSEKFSLFHGRFSMVALKNGWLQLRFLCLNGNLVAAIYNFIYNEKIYFYQCATNTHIDIPGISPGTLMIGHSIKEGISNGVKEFDFLFGDRPYKKRWTKTRRELKTILVSSDRAKIKAIRGVDTLKAHLRNGYRRLRRLGKRDAGKT